VERLPDLPVVMLTGHGTVRGAVEAMRRGVFDYLTKPFDLDEVDLTLKKAIEHRRLTRQQRGLATASIRSAETEGIVGDSVAIRHLLESVAAVARTDSTVLVTGESGTGKELVARAIHNAGPRRDRPFITVDCAAIPAALLESELFGHAKGSFTGAHADRPGYFEVAANGTIFLDEVGELELSLQKKFLRVLQEHTFSRTGESRQRTAEARVVAATNRDLKAEVAAGYFREDLYYRLQVIGIHLPPLRERTDDIPALVSTYLQRLNRKLHRDVRRVSPAAMEALIHYSWPGNVRELVNLLEQVLTFHDLRELDVPHLPPHILRSVGADTGVPVASFAEIKNTVVDEASRTYLNSLLRHYRGNISRVAAHSGIDRRHLHRLLKKLGLERGGKGEE
jgi:DNA-binding NtrC family response regulator